MLIEGKFYRTFRVDRLYFRYLQGSTLEKQFTTKSLASWLEDVGLIRLSEERDRYAELPKFEKYKTREALQALVKERLNVSTK